MKLSAIVFAFATLAVSAAHASECDLKLYDAVNTPELEKCETEAGFDFVALATPSDEVKTKFCKSEACLTIWQAAKTAAPAECTVKGKQLYADVLDPLEAACKKAGVATSSSSSSGNATSSHGSKNSTSHGHSPASGSMDSSDDDSLVKAPSNSTTKPTTAPASAATPSLSISGAGATVVLSLAAAALL